MTSPSQSETCTVPLGPEAEVCGKPILTMTYKGSGFCGDICRKRSGKLIMGEAEQAERLQARNP